MSSSHAGGSTGKPGGLAMAFGTIFVVAMIAALVGIAFLPNPYFAIGQVIIYAGLVVLVALKLRTCLRLAKGSAYLSRLHGIVFWVVLGVLSVVSHFENLFQTDDRDYIRLATNVSVYLALLWALELVEQLIKRVGAATSLSTVAIVLPNQEFQPSGPA